MNALGIHGSKSFVLLHVAGMALHVIDFVSAVQSRSYTIGPAVKGLMI